MDASLKADPKPKTEKEPKATDPISLPEPSKEPAPDDPHARARACAERIEVILAEYGCRIVPQLGQIEYVGRDGNKGMITAGYGIDPGE